MLAYVVLLIWVVAHLVQVVCSVRSFVRPNAPVGRGVPLILSAAGSLSPLATLVLVVWVFVVGGSSNVAQFAGESGLGLWSLWFRAYPWLLLGNPIGTLMCLAAVALPPYPSTDPPSYLSRVCGLVAVVIATGVTILLVPDA